MSQSCKVCLVAHDEEIHAATCRVHAWLRAQVMRVSLDATDSPTLSQDEPDVSRLNAA